MPVSTAQQCVILSGFAIHQGLPRQTIAERFFAGFVQKSSIPVGQTQRASILLTHPSQGSQRLWHLRC